MNAWLKIGPDFKDKRFYDALSNVRTLDEDNPLEAQGTSLYAIPGSLYLKMIFSKAL